MLFVTAVGLLIAAALTLAYLAALTAPLAGAAPGAFASVGFADPITRLYELSRGR
jgi:hypothetical protein